jgi:hypothetical protein
VTMAAMADFLDPPPPVQSVAQVAAQVFGKVFDFQVIWGE